MISIILRQAHILRHLRILKRIWSLRLRRDVPLLLYILIRLLHRILRLHILALLCRGFLPGILHRALLHARRIPVIGGRHAPPAALP